jgi:hypothetical protein
MQSAKPSVAANVNGVAGLPALTSAPAWNSKYYHGNLIVLSAIVICLNLSHKYLPQNCEDGVL